MLFKHMPSGLFPHFNSGLERRPLYPLAGDTVTIGLRLEQCVGDTDAVLIWNSDSTTPQVTESSSKTWNDNDQCYLTYVIQLPDGLAKIEYKFRAYDSNGFIESCAYSFEILQEILLEQPIAYSIMEDGVCVQFESGLQKYYLKLELKENINIFFQDYLTDKVADFTVIDEICQELLGGYCVYIKKPFSIDIKKDGKLVAEYNPRFRLLADRQNRIYQIEQSFRLKASAIYGFGEKFDSVNQRNHAPLSYVVEQYSNQQDKSYLPIPFFFTDKGFGYLQQGTWRTQFLLKNEQEQDWNDLTIRSRCPRNGMLFEAIIFLGTPAQIIKLYHIETGRPILPPKWAFGPWMSSNGWNTQAEALKQVEYMNSLAIPASVMVLEAWSDEENFYIWNDAEYQPRSDGSAFQYKDFTFPQEGKWPDPKKFTDILRENGLKLILWQIPVIKHEAAEHGKQLDLDTAYAIENGYCILNADGSPYRITEMWFSNSLMPDFTNPETFHWWFEKRKYLVTELGVSGFKTDGGEFLFDETAHLSDGRSIEEAHSAYPNLYIGAYHEFMNQAMGKDKGITFSRAGYTGAQRYPIHWAGDQISTFEELCGQLKAGLSLGLSGVPFWGFDIGGFSGDFPSTQLYLRATAFAAFAPVMQFHSEPRYGQYYMTVRNHWNNDRSPWNMAEANKDDGIILIYRLYANLRMNLLPYLWREAKFCADTARPMMAHLIYDYPEETIVTDIEDEYMLGRDMLVAPIITEGAAERTVWLPPGIWYDFWSGEKQVGAAVITYSCGLEKIPVFIRDGAWIPLNINNGLIMGSVSEEAFMPNSIEAYVNLTFISYGDGKLSYKDEIGTDLNLEIDRSECFIEGKALGNIIIILIPEIPEPVFYLNGVCVGTKKSEITMFGKIITGYEVNLT